MDLDFHFPSSGKNHGSKVDDRYQLSELSWNHPGNQAMWPANTENTNISTWSWPWKLSIQDQHLMCTKLWRQMWDYSSISLSLLWVSVLLTSNSPSQASAVHEPWNFRCSMVLEKAKEPEIKLPTSAGSSKKQESSRKTSISALLSMLKLLTVWITINCGKFWRRWEYQTTWPVFWETCMQVRKQQLELDMEQQTGSK